MSRFATQPSQRKDRLTVDSINLMFRAFSDPTRLRMLHILQDGELCVADLVEVLGVFQPTASRHLSYLRRAGLVEVRENGVWKFYRLSSARTDFQRELVRCLRGCFRDVPELAEDRRRAEKLRESGGCCPG
jgi:ArsR family transcriptional regulator